MAAYMFVFMWYLQLCRVGWLIDGSLHVCTCVVFIAMLGGLCICYELLVVL